MNHKESIIVVALNLKTSIIRSDLYDYSDAYILVSGTIPVTGSGDDDNAKRIDESSKVLIQCSFTSSWINSNTSVV